MWTSGVASLHYILPVNVGVSFQHPFPHFIVLTITNYIHTKTETPTQTVVEKHFIVHQGYVQKRWPAKTFLVGGDTEPQIDCFLDTFFFF